MAGITPIGQQQGLKVLQNILNKQRLQPVSPKNKTICYGSAKASREGGEDTQLSGDVSLVASGVAKDCTAEMLKEFLADKDINAKEVELLTKEEYQEYLGTCVLLPSLKQLTTL